jgi:hypothetical protein
MLLDRNEAWDRAMRLAESYREYKEVAEKLAKTIDRQSEELSGVSGDLLTAEFRACDLLKKTEGMKNEPPSSLDFLRAQVSAESLKERVEQLDFAISKASRSRELIRSLRRERNEVFRNKVVRDFLYLILRRSPATRHLL